MASLTRERYKHSNCLGFKRDPYHSVEATPRQLPWVCAGDKRRMAPSRGIAAYIAATAAAPRGRW